MQSQPNSVNPVVAIDDLHKSYADHHVLKGIALRANEGEVVSLICLLYTSDAADE